MIDINNIKIEPMSIKDLEEIKEILFTEFDDFWKYEIFKEELANNNSKYLVLRYNNEIICFGGIKIILDEANLMNIVTKKDMRNKGFGNILLKNLISLSKSLNCTSITLEVNEKNIPAISLYNNIGFQNVGKRKEYYQNGDSAILMTYIF